MTKTEVRQLLGTPLLTDIFHANRWDYYFRNEQRGQLVEQNKFAVFFENEKVVRVEGGADSCSAAGAAPAQVSAVRLADRGRGRPHGPRAARGRRRRPRAPPSPRALDVAGSPFAGRDAGELAARRQGRAHRLGRRRGRRREPTSSSTSRAPPGTLAHLAACRAAGKAHRHRHHRLRARAARGDPRGRARRSRSSSRPTSRIGVHVTLKLVDMASRALGPDYDVEVFEMHHKLKVDAPSGTALKLGEVAAAARGTTLAQDGVFARHGVTGERKAGSIGFSVARGGDMIGDHTVYFVGTGERIEITHRSSSRATYAQGAIRAAKWLAGRAPGLYDMDDVLGLRG